jgi:MGT family glycosyltransferase
LKFLWEDFLLPLARSMEPGVERAIDAYEPDVLVVDQQAVGGAIAARRRGLPWATFSTTSAGVVDPLRDLPKVQEWIDDELDRLMAEHGLPHTKSPDLSPHLVTVFSTAALLGESHQFPPHFTLVGPSLAAQRNHVPFPWDDLRPGPKVFVSLGTVNAHRGERFYRTLVQALRDEALQVILAAPRELVPEVPENFIVQPYVPQLAILPLVDAVVTHAGHNTVCESLAHGHPLVMTPITDDQPVVAQQVVNAGAGIRLKFHRVRAEALRNAVQAALTDPALRSNALRIRRSFAAAGGPTSAADRLEVLA